MPLAWTCAKILLPRLREGDMEDRTLIVAANEMLCEDAYLLEAEGEIPDFAPGQFAMLRVPLADRLLRRPLGIVQADKNAVTFLYQVKGEGTRALSRLRYGDRIYVLLPLGNGFPVFGKKVAIVGGGFGVAPLLSAARACADKGAEVRIYNGFASAEREFFSGLFSAAGKLTVCTDDGSAGFHGFPSAALEADLAEFTPEAILCCGPSPLMRAVKRLGESRGITTYLSLEQRMGCGVGACLTCTCKAGGHNKRVCKDGPVFLSTEVEP